MKLSSATKLAFTQAGFEFGRPSTLQVWHVRAQTQQETGYNIPILLRVQNGIAPWGVISAADVSAVDYANKADGSTDDVEVLPGDPGYFVELLLAGKSARIDGVWKPGQKVDLVNDPTYGPMLVMTLPNGKRVPYSVAPQDAASTKWVEAV